MTESLSICTRWTLVYREPWGFLIHSFSKRLNRETRFQVTRFRALTQWHSLRNITKILIHTGNCQLPGQQLYCAYQRCETAPCALWHWSLELERFYVLTITYVLIEPYGTSSENDNLFIFQIWISNCPFIHL